MTALAYDVKVVKFFPASCYGGLKTIEALAAPFSQIRFMPTGGVNAANLQTDLQSEKIIACGGSWMVKEGLLKEKRFDEGGAPHKRSSSACGKKIELRFRASLFKNAVILRKVVWPNSNKIDCLVYGNGGSENENSCNTDFHAAAGGER